MAKRRPSPSRSRQSPRGTADDAFTARILEFIAWARGHTQTLILVVVAAVLLVGGALYWVNQRAERLERAATELEVVQQTAMFQGGEEARSAIHDFVDRFDGTPYAVEARLLLAELYLEDGRPDDAVSVLESVAPRFRDPLAVQATFLLAVALEEGERWDEAADVYRQLQDRAELTFQKREAGEGLARVHLAQGDTVSAVDAYRALLDALDPDHPERSRYEMRLAELTAGGERNG